MHAASHDYYMLWHSACGTDARVWERIFVSYRGPAPLHNFVILGATVAAVFSVSLGPFVLMGQLPQASAQSPLLRKREGLRVCTLVIS